MTSTSHIAIGMSIAYILPWPLNVVVAFVSHLLADLYPEFYATGTKEEKINGYAIVISFGIVAGALMVYAYSIMIHSFVWWQVLCCIVAANAMDLDTIIKALGGKNFWPCHPRPRYKWAEWIVSKIGNWQVNTVGAWRTGFWDLGFALFIAFVIVINLQP